MAQGFKAAVMQEPDLGERLRKAGQLSGTMAAELVAALPLAPQLGRAVATHRCARAPKVS